MQSYAGAAVLTLMETRLYFCIPSRIQKVSGGLHYLLAKRPVNIFMAFFLDKCLSTYQGKTLFPLKCFFFNLHHPQSTKYSYIPVEQRCSGL